MGCLGEHGVNEYYREKIRQGEEYQDFVVDRLRKVDPCIIILNYSSRAYQFKQGESATGIEIKYDGKMKETGNLYFEIAEKSCEEQPEYTPSGIMRDDNTWLYLIGDYEQAFIFGKNQLRQIYNEPSRYSNRCIVPRQTPTSIGFTYKIENAIKYFCLRHIIFDG